jgi:hypothetical protein
LRWRKTKWPYLSRSELSAGFADPSSAAGGSVEAISLPAGIDGTESEMTGPLSSFAAISYEISVIGWNGGQRMRIGPTPLTVACKLSPTVPGAS